MDPNGGSVSDAINVTCRQVDSQWSTCIKPDDKHTKYQLWSLAMHSQAAYQTVSSSCSSIDSIATELIGANGERFSVRESSESILHKITVDKECKYTVYTRVPFQMPIVGWDSEEAMQAGEVCYA